MPRKTYRRAAPRRKKKAYSKAKKMVTGHGPTMLEQIAGGVGQVAKLAGSIAPIVAAINTEEKYFDASAASSAYNPGTNDALVNLTGGIATGTTDITRIGNSILARGITIAGHTYGLMSTTVHAVIMRITIFTWKENAQDNPPTAAKLFETPALFQSRFNKDYTDQFVILKDKYIGQNAMISAATVQDVRPFKYYKKLDWHMRFDAATASDHTQNHIFMMIRGNGATAANASTFDWCSRLNFTDN